MKHNSGIIGDFYGNNAHVENINWNSAV